MLSRSDKMIKRRRELLAVYVPTNPIVLRRIYPETFYRPDSFVNAQQLAYIDRIYEVFRTAINGARKTLIEDEINLTYMEVETRAALGKFSQELLPAIQRRLSLKNKVVEEVKALAVDIESNFPELAKVPLNIKFRLESTVYLVRLLAYGLFSDNDIVLERVAEVFDVNSLQAATKPRDKRDMDKTLQFLYRGLIQKNERGRQGNKHAARQTLSTLREWYPDNEYVIMCIEKLAKYM